MLPYAYMYGLPYEYYTKYHVRRYGAHGTCHLGNGSSVTAIQNGKCLDTSMGFTPLEGMIMGTRCGSVDPNIIPYIMKKENLTPDQMTTVMNKQSGFLGLSGKTSDYRDLDALARGGDQRAKIVLKKFTYDTIKIIGGFVAEMNGVDLIVITAGIGENQPRLRRHICENFSYLGVKIDVEVNEKARSEETLLTTADSTVKVALIPTNEELVIARDTMHIVSDLEN